MTDSDTPGDAFLFLKIVLMRSPQRAAPKYNKINQVQSVAAEGAMVTRTQLMGALAAFSVNATRSLAYKLNSTSVVHALYIFKTVHFRKTNKIVVCVIAFICNVSPGAPPSVTLAHALSEQSGFDYLPLQPVSNLRDVILALFFSHP